MNAAELAVTGDSREGVTGGKLPETRSARLVARALRPPPPYLLFGAEDRPLATARLQIRHREIANRQLASVRAAPACGRCRAEAVMAPPLR